MADSTARDLVTAALKDLGVLAQGETAPAVEADDALDALNRLIDQLAAEKLSIYTYTRTTWTLVSGTQNYTVGSGGTVNITWPTYVERVQYIVTTDSPTTERPLYRMTEDAWRNVVIKALTSVYPTRWYYNSTYPLGTLTLWPVPTSSSLQGVIYHGAAVSEFASLSTAVSFPPGYRRMLVKNLALELAPSYDRQPSPLLIAAAADSIAVVKRLNYEGTDLYFDPAVARRHLTGTYNIQTDQ